MPKIQAVKIIIDRAEGPCELCGPKTFEGENVWQKAQTHIDDICQTAPKSGYDKTDFKVIFADGEDYEGRIDLSHPSKENRDVPDLANHIAQHVFFDTGNWCPGHLTNEQYVAYLALISREDLGFQNSLRKFWETYEIPSRWAANREFDPRKE